MVRYDILLFDADETLFDYVRAARTALWRTLKKYGIGYPQDVWERYQHWNGMAWRKYEQGTFLKAQLQTERFAQLFGELGVYTDPAEFNQDYMLALSEGGDTIPGAVELCQALAPHCTLFIVTNGFAFTQERRLSHSPIRPYIKKMYISEQVGFQKPRKEFFDVVLADIGVVEKSRVLLLGDSLTSDMQGGINAGLPTCWYNPDKKASGGLCIDYEIHRLADFIPLVLNYST